jgi:hypothetical protein
MPSEVEIAWAAGLFEGEGCWNVYLPPSRRKVGRRQLQPQMKLAMTDGDVVRRFAGIVGCGSLRDRPRQHGKSHWKPTYEWNLYRRADIQCLIRFFWPYLGERRRGKAQEILDLGEAVPHGKRTHCPQGHPYAGDNLVLESIHDGKYTARRCKTCRRAQDLERKKRKVVA